jgi:hypothetical protein
LVHPEEAGWIRVIVLVGVVGGIAIGVAFELPTTPQSETPAEKRGSPGSRRKKTEAAVLPVGTSEEFNEETT